MGSSGQNQQQKLQNSSLKQNNVPNNNQKKQFYMGNLFLPNNKKSGLERNQNQNNNQINFENNQKLEGKISMNKNFFLNQINSQRNGKNFAFNISEKTNKFMAHRNGCMTDPRPVNLITPAKFYNISNPKIDFSVCFNKQEGEQDSNSNNQKKNSNNFNQSQFSTNIKFQNQQSNIKGTPVNQYYNQNQYNSITPKNDSQVYGFSTPPKGTIQKQSQKVNGFQLFGSEDIEFEQQEYQYKNQLETPTKTAHKPPISKLFFDITNMKKNNDNNNNQCYNNTNKSIERENNCQPESPGYNCSTPLKKNQIQDICFDSPKSKKNNQFFGIYQTPEKSGNEKINLKLGNIDYNNENNQMSTPQNKNKNKSNFNNNNFQSTYKQLNSRQMSIDSKKSDQIEQFDSRNITPVKQKTYRKRILSGNSSDMNNDSNLNEIDNFYDDNNSISQEYQNQNQNKYQHQNQQYFKTNVKKQELNDDNSSVMEDSDYRKYSSGYKKYKQSGSLLDSEEREKNKKQIFQRQGSSNEYSMNGSKQRKIIKYSNDYEFLKEIGHGSFGSVYKCLHKIDNNFYAVKISKKQISGSGSRKELLNEVKAMAKLTALEGSENIVHYSNAWIEDSCLYLAMELCESSLAAKQQQMVYFPESEIKKIIKEICRGLQLLHKQNIVHLDIKPENILVSVNQTYKIADLGLSRMKTFKRGEYLQEGDSRYLAKELLNEPKIGESLDLSKSDIYSLGISMYELMTQKKLKGNGQEWQDLRSGIFEDFDYMIENNNNKNTNNYQKQAQEMEEEIQIKPEFSKNSQNTYQSPKINTNLDQQQYIENQDEENLEKNQNNIQYSDLKETEQVIPEELDFNEQMQRLNEINKLNQKKKEMAKLKKQQDQRKQLPRYSTELINLVKSMMNEDQNKRPSAEQILKSSCIQRQSEALIFEMKLNQHLNNQIKEYQKLLQNLENQQKKRSNSC
ncbi:Protein kinase-like domain [Pseudocohnilembus persalinus]|uniref:non-specific serine/threonine protein kinase n=1 Tax=Pseudocohnilembus persalinus TaxID=266149 RepID=A0A0V0R3E5_PSEPJ|nr:Protein kinase-like domain [Pseudocohnilembus persalinus]|eukprot:KRX09010.1 Protein kinase-like domain [Pseudocohnilembus persalinus]